MAMTTHMSYDPYANAEMLSQIRYHYQGPFHFGAPDMVVVNLTRDKVWVRDGIVPDYPASAPPKFDIAAMGGLVIPAPHIKRQDIQDQSIRDAEIPPELYYPEGYKPELIPFWPTEKDIFIPADKVPQSMWLKGKSSDAKKALIDKHLADPCAQIRGGSGSLLSGTSAAAMFGGACNWISDLSAIC